MKKFVISLLLLSAFIMPVYAGLFDDIDKEVEQEQKAKQYKYWWEKAIDNCGNDYACKERILIKVGKDLEKDQKVINRNFQNFQMLNAMESINQNLQDISDQQAEFYRQQRLRQEMMYNQNQLMYDQWQLQNFVNY